ncbi:MAG TPA: hypothetical protein DF774_02360 [Rheinheimera sp.]|uniref:hypothetical protein n=1 Tax=Rheinheimera sp. TaxID=1869214 RepID=UPI000EC49D80|nr:hypothetical protein [Rheinheimera sp.]HCU64584.1 hypothetical protein [Rheinheimera sp.]
MSNIVLTETQRSVLTQLNFKPATAYAMAHTMKLDKVLIKNLLNQLVDLGVAKKYDSSSQYLVTHTGKAYLSNTLWQAASKAVEPVAELVDVDRPNEEPAEDLAALLAVTKQEKPAPDPVVVRAQAETSAIVTQLQPSKPALPEKIDLSLKQLADRLTLKPVKPLDNIELKLQVLEKLGALLDPTITEVLDAIADDLNQVQQIAADISKAA